MLIRNLVLTFVLIIFSGSEIYAAGVCMARARVQEKWVEDYGFIQKAALTGTIGNIPHGELAEVYLELEFHYTNLKTGYSGVEATSTKFWVNSETGYSIGHVAETTAMMCGRSRGQCNINAVVVTRKDCFY